MTNQEAIQMLKSKLDGSVDTSYEWCECVRLAIKALETADVKPVRHGHWYDNTYRYVGELDAYFIQACCSCCNRYSDKLDQYTKIMSNETCSHCGADMRDNNLVKTEVEGLYLNFEKED